MNFIDKFHIIRRALLIVFTFFFLKITYKIFCDGQALDAFKVSAYGIFAGIQILFVKFYLNSRDKDEEIKK
jgi:hypothetical protein